MAFDFLQPTTTDNYTSQFVPRVQNGWLAFGSMLDPAVIGTVSNVPTGVKRLNAGEVQEWNGTAWVKYALSYVDNTPAVGRGSHQLPASATVGSYSGWQYAAGAKLWGFITRNSDGLTGLYNDTDDDWLWYFDGTGALTGGTVPWARIPDRPNMATYALLASPTLTGAPLAPTASVDTDTTQIATTAWVLNQRSSSAPVMDGSASAGSGNRFALSNHRHPTDTSRAPVDDPDFTGVAKLNGEPLGLRKAPINNTASSAYTFSTNDLGDFRPSSHGTFNIPSGEFEAGDVFGGINDRNGDGVLHPNSGVTLYLAGDGDTGDRVLAPRAVFTVLCVSSNRFFVMGAGVS